MDHDGSIPGSGVSLSSDCILFIAVALRWSVEMFIHQLAASVECVGLCSGSESFFCFFVLFGVASKCFTKATCPATGS